MLTDAREHTVSGPRNMEKTSFLKFDLLCGPKQESKSRFLLGNYTHLKFYTKQIDTY